MRALNSLNLFTGGPVFNFLIQPTNKPNKHFPLSLYLTLSLFLSVSLSLSLSVSHSSLFLSPNLSLRTTLSHRHHSWTGLQQIFILIGIIVVGHGLYTSNWFILTWRPQRYCSLSKSCWKISNTFLKEWNTLPPKACQKYTQLQWPCQDRERDDF